MIFLVKCAITLSIVFSSVTTALAQNRDYNLSSPKLVRSQTIRLDALKLKTLDGQDFDWKQTEGKTVFINFWATWCGPCVYEMPSLQKLYNQLNRVIFFIFVTEEDSSLPVREFLRDNNFSLPIYLADVKNEGDLYFDWLPQIFRVASEIPFTYVLSNSGRCAYQDLGAANWNNKKTIKFLKNIKC